MRDNWFISIIKTVGQFYKCWLFKTSQKSVMLKKTSNVVDNFQIRNCNILFKRFSFYFSQKTFGVTHTTFSSISYVSIKQYFPNPILVFSWARTTITSCLVMDSVWSLMWDYCSEANSQLRRLWAPFIL